MFEKKNVNTLPKHRPYDYTIDLEEGAQLPFGPMFTICHKTNLHLFVNISTRISKRGSFDIPNLQLMPLFFWLKKIGIYKFVVGAPIFFVKKNWLFINVC